MGKKYNNLISTTAGFNYAAPQPLDDRAVVENYEDLATLVTSNQTYEGIEVYVTSEKKSYKLIGTSWQAVITEDVVTQYVQGMKTATTLPDDLILQANTMYFIGEVDNLIIGFPRVANLCDVVYVSFSTGNTTPRFAFTTNNYIGLDGIHKLQNYNYELIGMWHGDKWMFAIHEVER